MRPNTLSISPYGARVRGLQSAVSTWSALLLLACGPSVADPPTTGDATSSAAGGGTATTAESSGPSSGTSGPGESSSTSSASSSGDAPIDCEARNSQFDCAPIDCAGPFPIWDTGCGGAFVFDDDGCMRPFCHDDGDCGPTEVCYRETDCDPALDADGDGCYQTQAGYCSPQTGSNECMCFTFACASVGWCIPAENKPC